MQQLEFLKKFFLALYSSVVFWDKQKPTAKEEIIWYAILGKRLLSCNYKGHHRVIEPHVFGMKNGGDQLQIYQIRGESSQGKILGWRRLKLEEITNLEILDETFPGRRKVKDLHSRFDKIYVIVAW